jgi:hypothetical protein
MNVSCTAAALQLAKLVDQIRQNVPPLADVSGTQRLDRLAYVLHCQQ